MRRRKAIISMLTVLVVAGLFGPTSPPSIAAQPVDEALQRAVQFRATSGLEADPVYVARASKDSAQFSNGDWGVPLTEAEAAEVRRRADLQARLGEALDYAIAQPTSAGAYFDNEHGGVPVFAFVGDSESHRGTIANLVPSNTEFIVKNAVRTLDDLDKLKSEVQVASEDLRDQGVEVVLTGIDDSTNRVIVGVRGLTSDGRFVLDQRFGAGIESRDEGNFELDACIDRTNCANPIKGGLQITYTPTRWCTSGWIGKLRNSVPVSLRVITAGHCIELNGGVGAEWKHNGVAIGTAHMERWYSGTNADVGSIHAAEGGDRHLFFASAVSDIRAVTGYASNANQLVGYFLCRGGAKTGYLCGHIHLRDVDRRVEGRTVHHSWEVDFDASPGDSGAPYLLANTAYGIHTDSTDDTAPLPHYAWYSTMGWTLAEANISYCFNATCS